MSTNSGMKVGNNKMHLNKDECGKLMEYIDNELDYRLVEVEDGGQKGIAGLFVEYKGETTYMEVHQKNITGTVFEYRKFDASLDDVEDALEPEDGSDSADNSEFEWVG